MAILAPPKRRSHFVASRTLAPGTSWGGRFCASLPKTNVERNLSPSWNRGFSRINRLLNLVAMVFSVSRFRDQKNK